MKKVYVFTQNGLFWNKDLMELVKFEKATLYTHDEFLDHVKYIDDVHGKWIEISENGMRQIESKESLVDEIICEMRKWNRAQLMDYITDWLDKMLNKEFLHVMYTDIVLGRPTPEAVRPKVESNPSYHQQVDEPKKWGFQPCCENNDSPPFDFPLDGIMGEVRTLSDGKQYRYSGGIWLPVVGFNGPRDSNMSDSIGNTTSVRDDTTISFPEDVSLGHIYQAQDGNMYCLTKAGWLNIGNPPGTLDQYW